MSSLGKWRLATDHDLSLVVDAFVRDVPAAERGRRSSERHLVRDLIQLQLHTTSENQFNDALSRMVSPEAKRSEAILDRMMVR